MPNNWNTYKLGETCNITSSKRIFYDEYISSGIPFYRSKEIILKSNLSEITNELYISEDKFNEIKNKFGVPLKGDILLTSVGTIGIPYLVKEDDLFYFKDGNLTWLKDFKDTISSNFIIHWIKSNIGKEALNSITIGSTQSAITIQGLKNLELKLPPLQEQQSIASILSAIDDKIENNLAINKTLEEMAMALYKHWFVDFGPFQDGEFVESELGMIPKGWEVNRVKDFGDVITGKNPAKKSPEHFGDVIPFITPTDFKDYGKHIVSANRYISELGIKKLNKNILPINSVIVTCIGSDMGKVALSKTQSLTNQQINSLKSEHYLYMYCFFISNYTLLKRMAGDGTTMPIINKSSFENIKVIYPSKILLNDFEKLINDYDEQILSNTLENLTLAQLRDTLLPQLISGALRLKEFRE